MMTLSGSAAPPPQQHPQQQQQQDLLLLQNRRMRRPEDAALHITVSDPVQHTEGMKKYTSYRVDVRPPSTLSNLPGDLLPQDVLLAQSSSAVLAYSAVLRRYSDFLWLYERLHVERAGAIVPPLPEKQPVGRFSPAFVEDRRVHLERFLRRVAVHPELADAKCLDTFLRADDVTFQAAKQAKGELLMSATSTSTNMPSSSVLVPPTHYNPAGASSVMMGAAAQPPKKEGFKRWFAEAKTSIAGDLVKSPDDDLFEEIQRYVLGLDTQMKNVSNQATSLVRKGKEIANGLFEFGLAFNLLGQSEADALGDALGKMGETADRLSVLSAEHAEKEMAQFEEPLQDYIKMIHAVKLALQKRHEKRLTYSTCVADVDSKQSQLAKLRAQIGMEAKAYAAEMALRRSQEAAEAARDDFAAVSQRVLREVDRFKREKAEDMRLTVLNYINLQVDYNKRMEEIWASLIPQLERVQLDTNSNAIPFSPEQLQQQQQQQQQQHAPLQQQPMQHAPLQQQGGMLLGNNNNHGMLQPTSAAAPPPPMIQTQPPIYSTPATNLHGNFRGGGSGGGGGLATMQQPPLPLGVPGSSNISVQYRDPPTNGMYSSM